MNEQVIIPKWFYAIGVLAILWNLMGLAAFTSDVMMTPERLAGMPEARQQLYAATPSWLNIPYGVAVIAGVIGSIGLLLRKTWSVPILAISLLGVIAQQAYFYLGSGMGELVGGAEKGFMFFVLLAAVLLVWFAHSSNKAGRFVS